MASETPRISDFLAYMADRTFCVGYVTLTASQGDMTIGTPLTAAGVRADSEAEDSNARVILMEDVADTDGTPSVLCLVRGPARVHWAGINTDAGVEADTRTALLNSNILVMSGITETTLA